MLGGVLYGYRDLDMIKNISRTAQELPTVPNPKPLKTGFPRFGAFLSRIVGLAIPPEGTQAIPRAREGIYIGTHPEWGVDLPSPRGPRPLYI